VRWTGLAVPLSDVRVDANGGRGGEVTGDGNLEGYALMHEVAMDADVLKPDW
jgi:hypothetical protein